VVASWTGDLNHERLHRQLDKAVVDDAAVDDGPEVVPD
jgi:hypothetical protein